MLQILREAETVQYQYAVLRLEDSCDIFKCCTFKQTKGKITYTIPVSAMHANDVLQNHNVLSKHSSLSYCCFSWPNG